MQNHAPAPDRRRFPQHRQARLSPIGLVFTISVLVFMVPNVSAQAIQITGIVKDASGAVIANPSVELHSGVFHATASTDQAGQFLFTQVPAIAGTLDVAAPGFTTVHQAWTPDGNPTAGLETVLRPSAANEQVTVSATRSAIRLSDTPGSTILLTSPDLTSTPALRTDDILRQVPGFSLFV